LSQVDEGDFCHFFSLLLRLKEDQLEKVSMILKPGENSG